MKIECENVELTTEEPVIIKTRKGIYEVCEVSGGLQIKHNGKIIFSMAECANSDERSEMLAKLLKRV
jgi:hypothetical protein